VTTDAERLRGALINLILNARQAVNGRTAAVDAPNVMLSTRSTPHGVTITVTDNGSGIADADLPRVFDPYFTTKRGGTGLGLPIAKNIIEGLGGVLTVVSAAGQGTEMRIEFPTH
jgi:signal transduction histidine kinase